MIKSSKYFWYLNIGVLGIKSRAPHTSKLCAWLQVLPGQQRDQALNAKKMLNVKKNILNRGISLKQMSHFAYKKFW